MPTREVDLEDFARRVERLCDYLLDRLYEEIGKVDSSEQRILEDLKRDASDLVPQLHGLHLQSSEEVAVSRTLGGLDVYMRGFPTKETT